MGGFRDILLSNRFALVSGLYFVVVAQIVRIEFLQVVLDVTCLLEIGTSRHQGGFDRGWCGRIWRVLIKAILFSKIQGFIGIRTNQEINVGQWTIPDQWFEVIRDDSMINNRISKRSRDERWRTSDLSLTDRPRRFRHRNGWSNEGQSKATFSIAQHSPEEVSSGFSCRCSVEHCWNEQKAHDQQPYVKRTNLRWGKPDRSDSPSMQWTTTLSNHTSNQTVRTSRHG